MRRRQGPKITILFFIPRRRQRNRYGERVAHRAGLVGREGHTVRDVVLKYPIWQVSYRAAVIEGNPKLLERKIATAAQAVKSRFKELENSTDHHHEVVALTDALTALKILAETLD
jgi:hypothetical protein